MANAHGSRSPGRCSPTPSVLVLDEPTAHLDAETARSVTESVLYSNAGRTLIWVTHGTIGLDEMDEVLDLTR